MTCPVANSVCVKQACSWWDDGNKECSIKSIAIILTKLVEKVEDK